MLEGNPISSVSDSELEKVFQMLDVKGTGYIGAKELESVTRSVGEKISRKEIKKMINVADSDGDGKVDFNGE